MTIRRPIRVGLAALLLAAAGSAPAQPSPTQAPPRPGVFIVPVRPQPPASAAVNLVRSVDAAVRIDGVVATTTLRVTVANPGRARAEGVVLLPVPPGSSIRSFGIDGVGSEPTAELLPREEATRRYREIVARMVDPGLLEFVGTDLIQSSVFPVEPGSERVVTVVYEHAMPAHAGQAEYVLPRSASAGGAAWSVTVEVASDGSLGPVFSPTHPVITRKEAGKVVVSVPSLDEPGPFRLYASAGGTGAPVCLLYPERADAGWFLFLADAPEAVAEPATREVTIVLDRSGSMSGAKIEQARESARQIVAGLRPGERFNIIDYASDVRAFADAPVPMSDEARARALAYLDGIQARGGTNLHDALIEALRPALPDGHLGMVLFLTDGRPTQGVTAEAEIRRAARERNAAGRRVFTFGVGLDVNAPLLDAVALDTRAESVFVLPGESVELKVARVFDKLDGPVMVGPVFSWDTAALARAGLPRLFDVEPRAMPDLFAGSRVMVVGRYEAGTPTTLSLAPAGAAAAGTLTAVLRPEDASVRHAFVARLWAQKRIDALLAAIQAAGADGSAPDPELVDEVVRLSLEHGIMTEYTAFLASEDLGLAVAAAPRREDGSLGFGYAEARETVGRRVSERTGAGGVSQSVNRKDQAVDTLRAQMTASDLTEGARAESFAPKANAYYDADMQLQTVATVQRSPGGTLYRKAGRWEDARLGERADGTPDLVVEFATDDYWALADDLATQGRQWMLANRGEVYLVNQGRRVLVRNPS